MDTQMFPGLRYEWYSIQLPIQATAYYTYLYLPVDAKAIFFQCVAPEKHSDSAVVAIDPNSNHTGDIEPFNDVYLLDDRLNISAVYANDSTRGEIIRATLEWHPSDPASGGVLDAGVLR